MILNYKIENEECHFASSILSTSLIGNYQEISLPSCRDENTTTFLIDKLNKAIQEFDDFLDTLTEEVIEEKTDIIVDYLKRLKKSLLLIIKIDINSKFNLTRFPYQSFYQLIMDTDIKIILSNLFECITISSKIDLNFDVNQIPNSVIEKLLFFIFDYSADMYYNLDSFGIIIEFISTLIDNSPHLCELFISNGLFNIFDDWIKDNSIIIALESVIKSANSSHITKILSYCNALLCSEDQRLIEKSFHCFSLFIEHFDYKYIDSDNLYLLFKIIPEHIIVKCALELCLHIPDDAPDLPDILDKVLDIVKDPVIDYDIHTLCLSLMIHFSSTWKDQITNDDIEAALFFGAENKEFYTAVKYTECIIFYHKFDDFSFDMSVFNFCINFLESEIHSSCIIKMHEILTFYLSYTPDQISQMFQLMSSDVVEIINRYAFGCETENEEESEAARLILELLSSELPSEDDENI